MRLGTCLNTTPERVESGEYDIWFGISLGNKYFSKEHLQKYLPWLVAHVKNSLLIVIADDIHAINLEVFNKYSPERAAAVAKRVGEEKKGEILSIVKTLPASEQKKVEVVNWKEVETVAEKEKVRGILEKEFDRNKEFQNFVISIVEEFSKIRDRKLTHEDHKSLSRYILRELPLYINGAVYKDRRYLLQPYPGLGKLDELIMGLQNHTLFPSLAKKLNITNKIAIVEAYAN